MTLRALRKFRDKVTGEIRMPGDIFEASDERGLELVQDPRNVAEETEKEAEPAPEEPKKPAAKAPAKKPAAKKKK